MQLLARHILAWTLPFVLATPTLAQTLRRSPSPITNGTRHAGTYHLASGTWSRTQTGTVLAGPAQLYDNTCTVGLHEGIPEGAALADSARIPSTTGGGLADCYDIQKLEFGYCTYEPLVTSIGLSYYDCYVACDGISSRSPVTTFALVNLPGGSATGAQGCWIVALDLTNTTLGFQIAGDASGSYDNVPSRDYFGWSWTQLVPTTGSNAGPMLAGDPAGFFNSSCGVAIHSSGEGAGTDHPGWGGTNGPGTGIGSSLDQYELDGAGMSGCFWFGGYNSSANSNPLAAFYHKLWGTPGTGCKTDCFVPPPCPNSYINFCAGDGTAATCPGGAVALIHHGCPNSSHSGTQLRASGDPSFSHDTFYLIVAAGVPNKPGILLQSGQALNYPNGNNSVPDSAGLLCINPQLRGNVIFIPANGQTNVPDFQGQPFSATAQPPGTATYYQFWYRDPSNSNANPGPGAAFNFTNGVEQTWCF